MKLFLDASVLLAPSGSDRGASREIFRRAHRCGWLLLATPYVIEEVLTNLPALPAPATSAWALLRPDLALVDDVFTLDRAAVFEPAKDRPILFSALAWSEVLLTLDRDDFDQCAPLGVHPTVHAGHSQYVPPPDAPHESRASGSPDEPGVPSRMHR